MTLQNAFVAKGWPRIGASELLLCCAAAGMAAAILFPSIIGLIVAVGAAAVLFTRPVVFLYFLVVLIPLQLPIPWDIAIRDVGSIARIALLVVALVSELQRIDWRGRSSATKNITILVIVYVCFCVATVVVHGYTYNGTRAAFRLVSYAALYFSAILLLKTEAQIRNVVMLVLASSIVVCAYGYWQWISDDFGSFWHSMYDAGEIPNFWRGRITSFFLNDNPFAAYLNLILSISIPLMVVKISSNLRRLAIAATITGLTCMLLTQSRGALVAFVALLFAAVFFFPTSKATRVAILAALALTLLAGVAVVSYLPERYSSFTEGDIGRLIIWGVAIDLFRTAPLFGIGFGSFRDLSGKYLQFILDTHNLYLKVLAETGVLGAVMYFGLKWIVVRNGIVYRRASPLQHVLAFAVVGSIVTELVHGFADVMLDVPQVASMSFLILALFVAAQGARTPVGRPSTNLQS